MNSFFVFDTNTFISAFLFKQSNPRKALDKAIETGRIAASIETYTELAEVFLRPKFNKYVSFENRLLILKELKPFLVFVDVSVSLTACRDPKDNKFLELAVTSRAACIVTGDRDLLVLHPFENIPILNAADFMNSF